ncbi:MAG: universal stress protein [Chloroflexi bacterium]|nr:universal stress protein [Chloroflexota bacterium]
MYRQILLPLDGSALAEQALPYGLAVAQKSQATLHLFRALPGNQGPDSAPYRAAREYLDLVRQRYQELGINFSIEIGKEPPLPAILEQINAAQIDLVILTTRGTGGLGSFFSGKVATGLLKQVSVPMLTIVPRTPPRTEPSFPRMANPLVPLDLSPGAEEILPHALWLAKAWQGALHLLYVPPLALDNAPGDSIAERRAYFATQGQRYLDAQAQALAPENLPVETLVTSPGRAADRIMQYSDIVNADLIAMSTRHHKGWDRFLFGSVVDQVLKESHRPMLLMRRSTR